MKNHFKKAVQEYCEHDHILNLYAYVVFFITGENETSDFRIENKKWRLANGKPV